MKDGPRQLAALIEECARYLSSLDSDISALPRIVDRLSAADPSRVARRMQAVLPGYCGTLASYLTWVSSQGAPRLASAIAMAAPYLHWTTYNAYRPTLVGKRFPAAHAFAGLMGPDAPAGAEDFELGLFLIAPGTFYRDHRHLAPELYAPLTGPTKWRFNGGNWLTLHAHELVWNESMHIHATLVEETPFLCIYAWTQDIASDAEIVERPDWSDIEAKL